MAIYVWVASDGGLLPAPERVSSLFLAPGEQVALLVDFSKAPLNSEVFLQSIAFDSVGSQGSQTFKLVKFAADRGETDSFRMPDSFPAFSTLSFSPASKTCRFVIGDAMHASRGHKSNNSMTDMHTINGKTFESSRVNESVPLNSAEIWKFDNSMGDEPHPMHLKGTFSKSSIARVDGAGCLTIRRA